MKNRPSLCIVAGANGSGKTTFARKLSRFYPFVNIDEIARDIDPITPNDPSVQRKAYADFKLKADQFFEEKRSFMIESTLSGKTFKQFLVRAQSYGYGIHIIYMFLDAPALNQARIAVRVKEGGHGVPDIDVHRRFFRSIRNFWYDIRPLSGSWELYHNGDSITAVASSGSIMNAELYELFLRILAQSKNEK